MMEYEVNPLVIELEFNEQNFYYNNLLIIGKIHAVQGKAKRLVHVRGCEKFLPAVA